MNVNVFGNRASHSQQAFHANIRPLFPQGRRYWVVVGGGGGGGSHPSNIFYVRKLVKITSKVGQNRKLVPCCKKYNKRVNFGETVFKIESNRETV